MISLCPVVLVYVLLFVPMSRAIMDSSARRADESMFVTPMLPPRDHITTGSLKLFKVFSK